MRYLVLAATLAVIVAVLLAPWLYRNLRGLSLVVRGADFQGIARRAADLDTVPHGERLAAIPFGQNSMRARVYTPAGPSRQTVLLVSGLHAAGIDEPRLMALAGELAASRITVVSPDIEELFRFEITPVLTDRIEQAAVWLAENRELSPTGRIGLMGVSFSGGLSIVAAGRPKLRDRLLYVFSFGGHNDLPRVLRYLSGGNTVGAGSAPHDYGVAIVLLNVAAELVPADQVERLRAGIRRFLWASYLDGVDKPAAQSEFTAVEALAESLPHPSRDLLHLVSTRDVATLGPILVPHLDRYAEPDALSPSRSPSPTAPVFLLHGRADTVIPSSESEALAERLRGRDVAVHLLLTDLISHADPDQPPRVMDVARLARFWGDMLAR
jgi:fermentation-respiration switch protein FrsA (DUF1100 family)